MSEYSIEAESVESTVDLDEAKEQARVSLDFFAALALPAVMTMYFAPIMKVIWQLLTSALVDATGLAYYAIGLPRGHAKSTVVKLLAIWAIFFSRRKFILIVGSSQQLAENILADICDMLAEDNIRAVFGDYRATLEKDASDLKKFSFLGRPIIIAAMGVGSSVRGLNIKNERPDFMIFDDAQTRECALSQTASKEFQEKIYGTFLKLKSPKGCVYIYIGNMYRNVPHPESQPDRPLWCCLLRNLKDDKNWISFITGAILADGNTLWPELHSKESLLKELAIDKAAGQEAAWFAEVQNDPEAHTAARIDFSSLKLETYGEEIKPEGACLIIDPATDKPNSDDQIISHIDIKDGKPVWRRVIIENGNSKALIKTAVDYCLLHSIPLICVESVGYQHELIMWFQEYCMALQIGGITIQGVDPENKHKNGRIADMLKSLIKGDYLVHKEAYPLVSNQATVWNPMEKNNRDDILDTGAYIGQAMAKYLNLMWRPMQLEILATGDMPTVVDNNCIIGAR